ncbi:MAG: hypothetical protein OXI44_00690 [Bacteroidota bacterium]|nr:hypothetical protein [Bacteroidota bacterium]MXW81979.1 hypothetical protein [Rhodothermaceae bacterium]MXX58635.1 hypothetical protein [Rhodothermaceae bacterium]MYD19714.1 hypothetical protein [Rhodothermaceae bacterium]MYD57021.1 hypothetical protein [Rhodothermaceae bacterium]
MRFCREYYGIISVLVQTAGAWKSSTYEQLRSNVVKKTLTAPNTFTEEAIEFAVDQQMDGVTEAALSDWIGHRKIKGRCRVGVINAGNVPLVGLQDLLAVLVCGHSYVGVVSSKSPHLLPAFVNTLLDQGADINAEFVDQDEMWGKADAVIATGSNEAIAQIEVLAGRQGLTPDKCLFRGNRYGIAILNGLESENDLDGLALDVLLHEGMGCRNVALIMVPAGLEPDDCLKHFAEMRGVFPAHPSTSGRLSMQQAFLTATGQPHAYGDGLEFLLSKGAPEVQAPGHVRWVEYRDQDEMVRVIGALRDEIQCIVARSELREQLPSSWNVGSFGSTQTPALAWRPDKRDTIEFLCGL